MLEHTLDPSEGLQFTRKTKGELCLTLLSIALNVISHSTSFAYELHPIPWNRDPSSSDNSPGNGSALPELFNIGV